MTPGVAWVQGLTLGGVVVLALRGGAGLWVVLLLPLLTIPLVRGAGPRPKSKSRRWQSVLTSTMTCAALVLIVLALGKGLETLAPSESDEHDEPSQDAESTSLELRLDLGIEPEPVGTSTTGESDSTSRRADDSTGEEGSTGTEPMDDAEELAPPGQARRTQWLNARLRGADEMAAKTMRVYLRPDKKGHDKRYAIIFDNMGLTCDLYFGDDGDPGVLKKCRYTEAHAQRRSGRVHDRNVKLQCGPSESPGGLVYMCSGRYHSTPVDYAENLRFHFSL